MAKATSPNYRVGFRRRREGKTKYRTRFAMLKSRKPRLVVRKTNRDLVVHIVNYYPEGDRTLLKVTKKDLEAKGWVVNSNMPTAYLYGLLIGKKAKEKKIEEAILDIGLHTPTKNSIVFAVAKGANDGGLKVKLGAELDENRVKGEHIAEYAKQLKEKDKKRYEQQFSHYLKNSVKPEELPKKFEEVKEKIMRG